MKNLLIAAAALGFLATGAAANGTVRGTSAPTDLGNGCGIAVSGNWVNAGPTHCLLKGNGGLDADKPAK